MSDVGVALARARERFLGDGVLSQADRVRPEILDSWQRSRLAGVDASRLHLPFDADLDFAGRLVACAAPVLDQLEEELSGSAVSVVLTDPDGRVLDRRVGEGELRRRMDDISLAPGFSYAEEFAGTNGVGTALSGRAATLVVGAEHFTDRLQAFACAGAPVRHPVDGQLVGLLDVTCLRAEANDLMRVLALKAARDISHVLRERGSTGARAVMAAFQHTCARSDGPVLALSEDFLIANREAQAVLDPSDSDLLRQFAGDWTHGPVRVVRLPLTGGPVRARATPVVRRGQPGGVVLELLGPPAPHDVPPAHDTPAHDTPAHDTPDAPGRTPVERRVVVSRGLDGLVGSSPAWRAACSCLRDAARRRRTVVVIGEAGTGKWSASRAVHDEVRPPATRWISLDASVPLSQDLHDLRTAAAGEAVTVVVRHLERLGPADAEALAALVALVDAGDLPGYWVVGLLTRAADRSDVGGPPVAGFASAVVVPVSPLRHRAQDVPLLVEALSRRFAAGRGRRWTPAALSLLAGARWPGNVTELAEVLRAGLAVRPSGDVGPEDLPADLLGGTRRRLSPLEALERDLIVTALTEAGGNRSRAAEALGIGRATLYRRLRTFGIRDVGR